MSIFISHVEENRDTAEAISRGLQAEGFDAWSYESNSVPGPTYLSQVMDAIENADAMILVISPEALGSHQVAREIEAAHELDRPIIPVLQGITHEKYLQRRPEWRLALGAFTSIEVPREGAAAIMPKVVGGLEALGVGRGTGPAGPPARPAVSRKQAHLPAALRKPWLLVLGAVVLTALLAVGATLLLGSPDGGTGKAATPDTSATPRTPATPTGTPPEGGNSDMPQPLHALKATVAVEPTSAFSTDTISISYSLTNTSDYDFKAATTEIVVLVGASPGGTAVLLSDISQDIAAGATVRDTVRGNLAGASFGPQQVFLMVGERITGGSTGNVYPAKTPITVKR